MKRLIYLSYPTDNAMLSESQIKDINRSKELLLEHDAYPAAAVFDPGDAFMVRKGSDPGSELASINMHAVDRADAVLAWLPRGVSSIGVPMEIAHAGMRGQPVAVISDSYSWALRLPRDNVAVFPEGQAYAAIEWLLGYEGYEVEPENTTEPLPFIGDAWHGPTRAYADDAGLDLRVSEETVLEWGVFKDVPLGINVALPEWSWGFLVGRSSTFRKRKIEVMPGIIDTGYRGQLFAACIWRPGVAELGDLGFVKPQVDKPTYTLEAGERIAQVIIIPNGTRDVTPIQVEKLTDHARGDNGFGSSGA